MGDSDVEYDRKRRDKFKGERNESIRGGDNPRDDWNDSETSGALNHDREDYRGHMRDQVHSPDTKKDLSPTVKKMRLPDRDGRWLGYEPYGYGYGVPRELPAYHMFPFSRIIPMKVTGTYAVNHPAPQPVEQSSGNTQPPMMSLKAFLITQDDNITNEEALSKYNEYKLQFKRDQLNAFFIMHKDDEWFKIKYHPDDSNKRKKEKTIALNKRLEVFKEFLDSGKVDNVCVDADNPDPLVHLLNSVVIKLEGGTDFDLTVLNPEETLKSKPEPEDAIKESIKKNDDVENSDYEMNSDKEDGDDSDKKDDSEKSNSEETRKEEDSNKPEVVDITNDSKQNDDVLKPRALHRITSIFLRTIAPKITKSELETICKRFPGFMRLSIADPLPDGLWFRRGFLTFHGDVKIKEICWKLNNDRLLKFQLGAIVNRDLSKRIRSVNGITNHREVARSDMKLCADIINHFDNRSGLWQSMKKPTSENTYSIVSRNPVLHNITHFLIEKTSTVEEELLGENATNEATEKDLLLFKALDKMLLYLRIVHSVDFYSYSEYVNEDEMPNRCGIMHARCPLPINPPTQQEIDYYSHNFQIKANSLIVFNTVESEIELAQLGAKREEDEIEKFVTSNTQEITKDKWLCPLSGKKFIGPEFVRKHIFNKHIDKLDDVKKEVKYFNNYLRDLKRPQLPEYSGNKQVRKYAPKSYPPAANPYHMSGPWFGQYVYGSSRPPSNGWFRGGRPIINYRDLNMPQDLQENFI